MDTTFPSIDLPVRPPYAPMEALATEELPSGDGWLYEPKWDGFRCLVFRRGDEVLLQSKSGQTLGRYFPELAEAVRALPGERVVLDGEIVIFTEGALDFDALSQRIHPADSRIRRLASETAERWRIELGAGGLDGVVAKRLDATYRSGERTAMREVKRLRTADCVVCGFRYAQKGGEIGSLLVGLYDLEPLVEPPGFTGDSPGGPSRWSAGRSTEWQPLRPSLVCEVRYDHFSGGRFRHGTRFLRWRPDKSPRQCTYDQLASPAALENFGVKRDAR